MRDHPMSTVDLRLPPSVVPCLGKSLSRCHSERSEESLFDPGASNQTKSDSSLRSE